MLVSKLIQEQTMARIIEIFVKPDQYSDSDHLWFARTAFIYSTIGAIVASFYAVFYWYFASYGASISLAGLVVVCIATLPLHRQGKSRLLAKINLGATSLSLAGVVAHMGGIDSSAACWLLGVTPGITALLFRRAKEIVQLTAFTLVLYCFIFLWEVLGHNVYYFQFPEGSIFERVYTSVHFIGFSIFIALALAIFATTQKRLLLEVERQSRDVKAILANIHQGIFTINSPQLILGAEYSSYLEEILGSKEVMGKDIFELIFRSTDLTNEQKSIIDAILSASLHADSLNFYANEDNLVRQVVFRTQDGKEKILKIDWQPIINEKTDNIEKMLVTLLDVTQLKKMELENLRHKRQISIISELTEIEDGKFERFMRSTMKFLEENHRMIASDVNSDDLKILFVNMHTIKGAARTFHLSLITSIVHDCEQYFSAVQQGGKTWNREEAEVLHEKVRVVVDEYNSTYIHKLRRGDNPNVIKMDLAIVKENIRLLKEIDPNSQHSPVRECLEAARKAFFQAYFTNIDVVFKDLCNNIPTLAKDLGKPNPQIDYRSVPVGLTDEGCDLLRNIFVHILRNTMDHGIESAETRRQSQKTEQGRITIDITIKDTRELQIVFGDDGAGLKLDKIYNTAVAKSLIDPDVTNPNTVAYLIFHPGLSTAKSVTDISGRGVGMSAVLEYLTQMGGKIQIDLLNSNPKLQATPFRFVMTLPANLFSVLALEQLAQVA